VLTSVLLTTWKALWVTTNKGVDTLESNIDNLLQKYP